MITLPSQRYLAPLLIALLVLVSIHFLSVANYSFHSAPTLASHPSHHPLRPPPPEYPTSYPADPDPTCEARHGLAYLQHIAQNHIPYCEPAHSRSGFECFKTVDEDNICVASGVQYTANRPPSAEAAEDGSTTETTDTWRPFSMHCKMRNLTQERIDDPSPAHLAALDGFHSSEKFKEYMYWTGIGLQLQSWQDNDGETCNAQKNDATITLLTRREQTGNIWHRLLELWQVKHTLDALSMSGFIPNFNISNVRIVFHDDTKGPWDDLLWPMVTGTKPLYISELQDACLGHVILPLVGSSSPFWWSVWEARPCRTSFLHEPFIRAALSHMGLLTPPRLADDTVVTIINRTGASTTRQLWNIDSHAAALRNAFPDTTVQVLDFAAIDLRRQIEIVRGTDVLLGAMGAGLTHMFFLGEEASVGEVLAPGAEYWGFRNLAKVQGRGYFVMHGVPEEEFRKGEEWRSGNGATQTGSVTATAAGDGDAATATAVESSASDAVATTALPVVEGVKDVKPAADEHGAYKRTGGESGRSAVAEKRHWQNDPYLYLSEKQFLALAGAAINAQGVRGTRRGDVVVV